MVFLLLAAKTINRESAGPKGTELFRCLTNQCVLTDVVLSQRCRLKPRCPPPLPPSPIHPLESHDIIYPLKFKFQRIFSPPAPRLAVQCVSVSVHWVEINFSTNLVIARRSFRDHAEAARRLCCRQAGRFCTSLLEAVTPASESGLRR